MPDYSISNSAGRIAPGIDVRGDGGYVVGPGSKTPGGAYSFVPARGPSEVKIVAAPAWLLRLIGRKPDFGAPPCAKMCFLPKIVTAV